MAAFRTVAADKHKLPDNVDLRMGGALVEPMTASWR
jgi:hypothetical protein